MHYLILRMAFESPLLTALVLGSETFCPLQQYSPSTMRHGDPEKLTAGLY